MDVEFLFLFGGVVTFVLIIFLFLAWVVIFVCCWLCPCDGIGNLVFQSSTYGAYYFLP